MGCVWVEVLRLDSGPWIILCFWFDTLVPGLLCKLAWVWTGAIYLERWLSFFICIWNLGSEIASQALNCYVLFLRLRWLITSRKSAPVRICTHCFRDRISFHTWIEILHTHAEWLFIDTLCLDFILRDTDTQFVVFRIGFVFDFLCLFCHVPQAIWCHARPARRVLQPIIHSTRCSLMLTRSCWLLSGKRCDTRPLSKRWFDVLCILFGHATLYVTISCLEVSYSFFMERHGLVLTFVAHPS